MPPLIRDERPEDIAAIRALIATAFDGVQYSDGTEPAIVDRLRQAGALAVSLVADHAGEIIGHVAFSPVTIAGASGDWMGLAPLAVRPDRQRQGIGDALVRAGLVRIRVDSATGCILLGDPAYYGRFGFTVTSGLHYGDMPPGYLQLLAFGDPPPDGAVHFHPAFDPASS